MTFIISGCSSGGDNDDERAHGSRDEQEEPAGFGTVADAEAPPGSPALCGELIEVPGLVGLGDAVAQLGDPETRDQAVEQLGAVADAIRDVDEGGDDGRREQLDAVAGALDDLAAEGLEDDQTEAFAVAIDRLGVEVQAECDFPLG